MNFYEYYLKLCNERGKTPSAVALEMGFSKPTVSRWKNGGGISDATKTKVADYFNLPASFLINSEYEKIPAYREINGLKDTRYYELSPENQKLVDQMIAKLYKSQSAD